ncbi:LysR family transcriptional regulator [Archangium sp.]|uniref:LysR family transcriptional regulator n=1 Tax=Archangium sp. TaxID=1872627 RepID=UPI00286C82A5|nr:LysR family transcriptional regulator [Archangium sp.]
MEGWDDLRVLLAVHREKSFAGAARRLGVDATTVGRRLSALEERLGVRLVLRSRHTLSFAPAAAAVIARAEVAERAIEEAMGLASQERTRARGLVRITTTEQLAALLIAPALPSLRGQYPELEVELRGDVDVADLAGREADIALRAAKVQGDGLLVRRAGELAFGWYAAPRWVGPAQREPDAVPLLVLSPSLAQPGERATSRLLLQGRHVVLQSPSAQVLREAAAAGLGVALLPCLTGEVDGRLVRVRREPGLRRSLWVVVHRDQARIARVRAVSTWLMALTSSARQRLAGEQAEG